MNISLPDLLICIVVYENKVTDCETFISLNRVLSNETAVLDVLVYDNSRLPDNEVSSYNIKYPKLNFKYIHNKNNPGLGIAYNEAATIAKSLKKGFLCFFDQDSNIPKDYFTVAIASVFMNPTINLFSPIVISDKIIISPSSFFFGRSWVKNKREVGVLTTKNHSIINSGSIIRLAEFNKLGGYEPSLPLDFSDHYFFYKYKQGNSLFFTMPIYLEHNLSTFFDKDYNKVFKRFTIYCEAAVFFAKNTKNSSAIFWAFLHSVKLSFVYRRSTFIKHALSILKK